MGLRSHTGGALRRVDSRTALLSPRQGTAPKQSGDAGAFTTLGIQTMKTSGKHVIRPATLEAIVDAAVRLLNVNIGASLSEIAIHAGIGRATLHRHFRDRNDLIRFIGTRCIEEMNAAVLAVDAPDKPAIERLRSMFVEVAPLGDRYNFLRLERRRDEGVRQAYNTQLGWVDALVEDLRAQGEISREVPVRWVTAQIDQLVWTAWQAVAEDYLSAAEASELAMRTLLNGLKD
ncbi:MAG: TetR/AcrR family transcriptional regulator [Gammaproteobacteria bacterium]|nr:TetR/AcrR family transcriptional regulator [Gammaproteobacteria bacterium]